MNGVARAPLVSVVLPVRNAAAYVAAALGSLWGQTLEDFEVVVVDDGSTDGTEDLLSRESDARLVVVRGPGQGIAEALNTGLARVRGTFIARMDADDVSAPSRLQRQISFLNLHPEVGVVGSNIAFLRSDGRATARRTRLPVTPEGVRLHLHIGNCLPHPTAVLRRDVLEHVGGYRVDRPAGEDYDLWLRLLATTQLANVEDCLVHYRQHGANTSSIAQQAGAESVVGQVATLLAALLDQDVDAGTARRILLPNEPVHDAAGVAQAAAALHALASVLDVAHRTPSLSAADTRAVRRRHDYVAARLVTVILKHGRLGANALMQPAVRAAFGGAARGGADRITDKVHDLLLRGRRDGLDTETEGGPVL